MFESSSFDTPDVHEDAFLAPGGTKAGLFFYKLFFGTSDSGTIHLGEIKLLLSFKRRALARPSPGKCLPPNSLPAAKVPIS